jgi:hypothetical protein
MAKRKPSAIPNVPIYRIDPGRAFPEVPRRVQTTSDSTRPVSSLVILAAYLMSGHFPAMSEDQPYEVFIEEIQRACLTHNVDIDLVFKWAESLLIPPDEAPTAEELAAVPTSLPALGWNLRQFQVSNAAWAVHRLGSILAMGCGVGKSGTATAAAIAAARVGRCRRTRCYIYCPVNAMDQWLPYCVELEKEYEDVHIFSIDSAFNAANQALDRTLGGAMIVDELHKLKSDDSRRGQAVEKLRNGFEWSVGLTGTLLSAGAEGVLRVQDIVLPGLSRFLNKWAFGDVFDATYTREFEGANGRKQSKTSIGMPPDAKEREFTLYMSRAVRSLSFNSPEVRDCLVMPDHSTIDVADWELPDWVREHQREISKLDSRNQVYWAPDWSSDTASKEYLGALALAIRDEDPLKELPTFPRVMQAVCKEGRIDRVIQRVWIDEIPHYRFVYNPSVVITPGEPWTLPRGPKIAFVRKWLEEHDKESLVIGAVGTLSCLMAAMELEHLGISYNVIDGRVKSKDRGALIKDFQDGKIRVMILQQAAGAESITLTHSNTSILLDHNWSAATYTQFIHRTYRTGQKEDCEHYDLQFGRIQERVVSRLRRGQAFDQNVRGELEKQLWDKGSLVLQ